MARIMIANLFEKTIETTDDTKPLLKQFQENGLDWMHACGGKGRCTTCKVIIKTGGENFSPPTIAEKRYAHEGALKPGERLACQAKITGDVCITVPREYQLPHVRYSAEA
jgi:ferredoxin, 2Fe-2S